MAPLNPEPCPPFEVVLLASDGALPPAAQRAITAHVQVCATCRLRLAQVEAAARAYVDYYETDVRGRHREWRLFASVDADASEAARYAAIMARLESVQYSRRRVSLTSWAGRLQIAAVMVLLVISVGIARPSMAARAGELVATWLQVFAWQGSGQPEGRVPAARSVAPTPTAPPAPVARTVDRLAAIELDARLALAELDVYDAVRVRTTPERVRVDAVVAPGVQHVVQERLAALPHVDVVLRPSPAVTAGASDALTAWVDRRFGAGSGARTTFVPDLRRYISSVRARLVTLSDVAERYPGAVVSQMPPDEQTKFTRLRRRYYQALQRDLEDMRPIIGTLAPDPGRCDVLLPAFPRDWRRRAAEGVPLATRLDQLVRELLAGRELPPDETPYSARHIGLAYAALWEVVQCQ